MAKNISLDGVRTYSVAPDGTVIHVTRSHPTPTPSRATVVKHKLIASKKKGDK